jgi:hypothetical protein
LLSISIYLGESLQWNTEQILADRTHISVPRHNDHLARQFSGVVEQLSREDSSLPARSATAPFSAQSEAHAALGALILGVL